MESVARQLGQRPQVLDSAPEAELPECIAHVWDWYCDDLMAVHTSSGFGLNPLTPADIAAWASLMEIPVTPFEARLLFRIDLAFVASTRSETPVSATGA